MKNSLESNLNSLGNNEKNLKTQYTPKKKKISLEGHSGPGIETELGLVAHQLQTNSGLSSGESCFADQHFKIIPHITSRSFPTQT